MREKEKRAAAGVVALCCRLICGLLFFLFFFLSAAAFVSTCVIDPQNVLKEHILFIKDRWWVNLAAAAAAFILFRVFLRRGAGISQRTATVLLLAWVTAWGAAWIVMVKSVPEADSLFIVQGAADFMRGDFTRLLPTSSYFRLYPYQLGFTLVCEGLMRLFGPQNYVALEMVNLLCLEAAYLALLRLTRLLFESRAVTLAAAALLFLCLPPLLACTFIYGILPGFAFAMWAVALGTEYLKTGDRRKMLMSSLCIALAVAVKPNYAIVLAAMGILLILDFLQTKRRFSLLFVCFSLALSFGVSRLVPALYEARSGAVLSGGVPMIVWTAMGLQESAMAPGWYNGYPDRVFEKSGYDRTRAAAQARADIEKRLVYFYRNPRYAADFFGRKVLSQWNEPTYESLWLSQAKGHSAPVPPFVESLYTGGWGKALRVYLNLYQQMVFIGFLLAMAAGLKTPRLLLAFLPLVVSGGFFYHLVNEGKSQYILIYFLMLLPFSARGLCAAAGRLKKIRRFKGAADEI